MPVPTRFIEGDEYRSVMEQEAGGTQIYTLAAIPFAPPTEEGDGAEYDNYRVLKILLLNVDEPRIYKDPAGPVYVVLPKYHVLDYKYAEELHPAKGMWCYRFAPLSWTSTDFEDSLGSATYLFDNSVAPQRFELSNPLTH